MAKGGVIVQPVLTDFENLNFRRKYLRDRIARRCQGASELTSLPSFTEQQYCELVELRRVLNELRESLVKLDHQLSDQGRELTEDEWLREMQGVEEYEDKLSVAESSLQGAIMRYNRRNHELLASPATMNESSTSTIASNFTRPRVNLPKLEIKPFSGKFLEWVPFWDNFQSTIHNDLHLTNIERLQYLKSFLRGQAYDLISDLPLSEDNYIEAKEILMRTYGKKKLLRQHYVQNLMSLPTIKDRNDVEGLRRFTTQLRINHHALRSIQINDEIVFSVISPKIPEMIYLRFTDKYDEPEQTIDKLLEFLQKEIERLGEMGVRSQATSSTTSQFKQTEYSKPSFENQRKPSATTLNVDSEKVRVCIFCEGNHLSHLCKKEISLDERWALLKRKRACFRCLRLGHSVKTCKIKFRECSCGQVHFSIMCPRRNSKPETQVKNSPSISRPTTTTSVALVHPSDDTTSFLQVAGAQLITKWGSNLVTVLFDGGSQRSYIREKASLEGHLEVMEFEHLAVHTFGGQREEKVFRRVRVILNDIGGVNRLEFEALETPILTTYRSSSSSPIVSLFNVHKLNTRALVASANCEIDILLGVDVMSQLLTGNSLRLTPNLMAMETRLGWTAFGTIPRLGVSTSTAVHLNIIDKPLHEQLQRFWELESIGVCSPTTEMEFDEEEFKSRIKFDNQRYTVPLPWRLDLKSKLKDNYSVAKTRFNQLLAQMRKKNLFAQYGEAINKYVNEDHAELVERDSPVNSYYLPHRAVLSEVRSTKVRIVFDASSHDQNELAINDCLFAGNDRSLDVVKHLFNFRVGKFAMAADIQKAFLQIAVEESDRNYLKYLWLDERSRLRTYRMTRVPFGLTCSPYLLKITLQYHAEVVSKQFPVVRGIIRDHTYVDDIFHCEDELSVLEDVAEKLKFTLKEAQMEIHKVRFSSKEEVETTVSVLGLRWDSVQDTLEIKLPWEKLCSDKPLTKRELISRVSSIYDPLGFLSPVTSMMKLLFQQTWTVTFSNTGLNAKLKWDDVVSAEIQKTWEDCVGLLKNLRTVIVPRCVAPKMGSLECSGQLALYDLHIFCDASPKIYGAVAYLWGDKGTYFLFSKFRIAPSKLITLPRLELLAALVGARIATYICKNLPLSISKKFFWSDSMIALGWINTKKFIKQSFITNRINEIRKLSSVNDWYHCPSFLNLADVATKFKLTNTLDHSHIWWTGPTKEMFDVMYASSREQLSYTHLTVDDPISEEDTVTDLTLTGIGDLIDLSRFSSKTKLIRTTARVLLAVNHFFKRDVEWFKLLEAAEIQWVLAEQSKFFGDLKKLTFINFKLGKDEKGRLRLCSRLGDSDFSDSVVSPILLSNQSYFSYLMVRECHVVNHHCGVNTLMMLVRQRYWVLSLRKLCKKIIYECVICRRFSRERIIQPLTDLPHFRVSQTLPFVNVGIDFAGPLFVRHEGELVKAYILVFACATSRAVHLELTLGISAEETLLALRRFISRRGVPSVIYSDNARTFKNVAKTVNPWCDSKVAQFVEFKRIEWKFIPERAPWWGGMWERMVRSIKEPLRKVLGRASLTYVELLTLVVEVECLLNSRPLTVIGDQPDTLQPLTPALLIMGRHLQQVDVGRGGRDVPVQSLYQIRRKRFNHLLTLWRRQYLSFLPSALRKDNRDQVEVKENDVVIVTDEAVKKSFWVLGRVKRVNVGRDGAVRSCLLVLPGGKEITRPVKLLIPLVV